MKNKALTLIELIISLALFFITLFPLVKFIQFSFASNRREYNFENFGKDSFTEKFFIPYPINKNSNLKLEISKTYYQFEDKKYDYLEVYFMYIDSNKSFESRNLVSNW